jgi:hypothetical protein
VADGWRVVTEKQARSEKLKAAFCSEWPREVRHETATVLRRLKEYDYALIVRSGWAPER